MRYTAKRDLTTLCICYGVWDSEMHMWAYDERGSRFSTLARAYRMNGGG